MLHFNLGAGRSDAFRGGGETRGGSNPAFGPRHGHLGSEGVAEPVDANVGDTRAFACTVQAFPDIEIDNLLLLA